MSDRRVLLLCGGWEGHQPDAVADWAHDRLLRDRGVAVTRTTDLDVLASSELAQHDLLVAVWTWGTLTPPQEQGFERAVRDGLGLVSWHGGASGFLGSRVYRFVLGGEFVDHPGGETTTFTVEFDPTHPLAADLETVELTTEQYYLLVDPAVDVVATTTMIGSAERPWTAGVRMPVAWTRRWGEGRVFYCALGHAVAELELPPVLSLLRRAVASSWRAGPA